MAKQNNRSSDTNVNNATEHSFWILPIMDTNLGLFNMFFPCSCEVLVSAILLMSCQLVLIPFSKSSERSTLFLQNNHQFQHHERCKTLKLMNSGRSFVANRDNGGYGMLMIEKQKTFLPMLSEEEPIILVNNCCTTYHAIPLKHCIPTIGNRTANISTLHGIALANWERNALNEPISISERISNGYNEEPFVFQNQMKSILPC